MTALFPVESCDNADDKDRNGANNSGVNDLSAEEERHRNAARFGLLERTAKNYLAIRTPREKWA